ncbi:DsbA family oxidoreductase [Nocardioides campestrisoli]|uniref:DsbA family oxidoreductase n=1 Tax=Nocardioides campestrisoli TaxID=2736757 RepID=UPI00163DAF6C|nr:DsbA family oxidoreductase [Nocardioides campestrisoli]
MRIEIWSDVVCPWCYIGKRRMETALADFGHADEVEVVWRSFQLDPTAPRTGGERSAEMLAVKYGMSPEQVQQAQAQITETAAAEGLEYRLDETRHVNTVDAHRVIHLALAEGGPELQGRVKEALLKAYFTEARNVADPAVLREVAVDAGLDADRVDAVLASDEFTAEVSADIEQARRYGATGVPFFVIDQKYGVSGAQPAAALAEVLTKAWEESRPSLSMVDGGGDVCGPEGCTP